MGHFVLTRIKRRRSRQTIHRFFFFFLLWWQNQLTRDSRGRPMYFFCRAKCNHMGLLSRVSSYFVPGEISNEPTISYERTIDVSDKSRTRHPNGEANGSSRGAHVISRFGSTNLHPIGDSTDLPDASLNGFGQTSSSQPPPKHRKPTHPSRLQGPRSDDLVTNVDRSSANYIRPMDIQTTLPPAIDTKRLTHQANRTVEFLDQLVALANVRDEGTTDDIEDDSEYREKYIRLRKEYIEEVSNHKAFYESYQRLLLRHDALRDKMAADSAATDCPATANLRRKIQQVRQATSQPTVHQLCDSMVSDLDAIDLASTNK